MTEYDYIVDPTKEVDFWAATCSIQGVIGIAPLYMNKGEEQLTIVFTRDLTANEKTLLDAHVLTPGFGAYPSGVGITKMYIKDFWQMKLVLSTALGKPIVAMNFFEPQPDGSTKIAIYVDGTATTQGKSNFKKALGDLLEV